MEDVHLVHVLQALTYLPDERDSIKFHESVVLINDPVKQFPSANTRVEDRRIKLCIAHTNKADDITSDRSISKCFNISKLFWPQYTTGKLIWSEE